MVDEIREWITSQAINNNVRISDDTDLYAAGILDSFGVIELLSYMTEELGITIDINSLNPDNFMSINMIKSFLNES